MKVAIFGGSFDPPHIGHEQTINQALLKLDIDLLLVIPTFLNPFKEKFFTPASIRMQWMQKLVKKYSKVKILDYEIMQNRAVSSIETVEYIIDLYKPSKIYLIIGADNLEKLPHWNKYERLKDLVEFVIASRDDIKIPINLKKLNINVSISSTNLRDKLDKKYLPAIIADEIIDYREKDESKS